VIHAVTVAARRHQIFFAELRKFGAFMRRDFLVAWSYRMAFVSDLLGLVGLVLVFYFISLMVDPSKLPTYGGTQVTYLEFAAVGMTLGIFIQFALQRVAAAMRAEQLMGTLESLLVTPTSRSIIQLGSVAFDLVYTPLRTVVFLLAISFTFGLHFDLGGLPKAAAILLLFVPFIWGLGVASAAGVLTFRRGSGLVALGAIALSLVSGIYFPLDLLPAWLSELARLNPVAMAINGMRDALLGGASWSEIAPTLLMLIPLSAASLAGGLVAFRYALRRENRLGTLGLY